MTQEYNYSIIGCAPSLPTILLARQLMLSGKWRDSIDLVKSYELKEDDIESLLAGRLFPDETYSMFLNKSYSYVKFLNKKIRIHSYVIISDILKEQIQYAKKNKVEQKTFQEITNEILFCINDNLDGTIAFFVSELLDYNDISEFDYVDVSPEFKGIKQADVILVADELDIPDFIEETGLLEHLKDNLVQKLSIKNIAGMDDSPVGKMKMSVRIQAKGDYISLTYLFEGIVKTISVPRIPFERWVLSRPELFFLTDNWVNVVPSGYKRTNDNQDHSDWLFGSSLDVEKLSISGEYKPLHAAASQKAFEIGKKLTQIKAAQFPSAIPVGFYSFPHKKIKKYGVYLVNEEIGPVFIIDDDTFELDTTDGPVFRVPKIKNANLNKVSFVLYVGLNDDKEKEMYLIIGA